MDSESAESGRTGDDLSALAWVHGELRRSLDTAHKALRRYLREAESAGNSDVDAVDPSVLRTARTQLHQGVGALELVGFPAVADVLRASELSVQRMIAKPAIVDAAAVDVVEHVSFALLDFLGRQLAGKPVSPVALFPQYRAALQLAGADRVHPADLWKIDWQWLELPPDPSAVPRTADDDARGAMETLVLALMRDAGRDPGHGPLARMSDLCADLGAGARMQSGGRQLATFWQLAAAVFEAQAGGLLTSDTFIKRIASRLLAQLRMCVRGQPETSDRLAQDLLFFCSHARLPAAGRAAPRLMAVRQAWRLADQPTADYDTPRLGRFDPALLALARKRVAAARDSWSAAAGGEQHRLGVLAEQFTLVGESLTRLFPSGDVLAQALQSAVAQTLSNNSPPAAPLAMEVATGILYLDASLEDGELDQPELAERVQRLARRIDDVRIGADPQPLDLWMEELYRRVSDRQTMGSVVQELRASLSEIEKQIDQYFRNPAERQVLIPVPAQLSAMRGVLSVLGLSQASQAVIHMRDEVDALAQTEVDPQRAIETGTFDRLADNLGALSFLIDMLSVQPQLAKSLFRYDPESGSLSAVMGQSERVSAFAGLDELPAEPPAPPPAPIQAQVQALADAAAPAALADDELASRIDLMAQQALAADQPELSRRLSAARHDLRSGASTRDSVNAELMRAAAALAGGAPEAPPPSAPVPPPHPAPVGGTGLEDDAEMREIFIEEAREVVTDARAALERLADAPENAGDMTNVRRAFHTLKGSSRMVGLREFGDAAWACEQLYNARLASAPRMDVPLRILTGEALAYLGDWAEAIADSRDGGHNAADVARAADALRLEGARQPITLPARAEIAPPAPAEAATEAHFDAPTLVLNLPIEPEPTEAATPPFAPAPGDEPTLVLDLPVERAPAEDAAAAEAQAVAAPVVELPVADVDTAPEYAEQPTMILPRPTAPEPAAAPEIATPAAAAPPAWEDDLPLDFGTATEPLPLTQRVPELPSAADLELSLPASAVAPEAEALSFELDLGDLDDASAPPPPAEPVAPPLPVLETPDLLDLPLDAPVPELPAAPGVEAVEIDLDDMVDIFGATVEAAPVSAPATESVLEQPDGLGLDDLIDLTMVEPAAEPAAEPVEALALPALDVAVTLPIVEMPEELPGFEMAEELTSAETTADLPFDEPALELPASLMAADLPVAEAALDLSFDEAPAADLLLPDLPEVVEQADLELPEADFALDLAQPQAAPDVALPDFATPEAALDLSLPEPEPTPVAAPATVEPPEAEEEPVRVIGPLRISIPLFNIFLNEADELSRRLVTELAEWAIEYERHPVPDSCSALAHSLAGNSGTVGYIELSALARALEHALIRSHSAGHGRSGEAGLFSDAAEEIRRLLHQFAAGFLYGVDPGLMARLAAHERLPIEAVVEDDDGLQPAAAALVDDGEDIDAVDALDTDLFPIFEEEAEELLPQLQSRLRDWLDRPGDAGAASACMRTLHTFKGGARLSGALRLGEMAHRLETAIEHLSLRGDVQLDDVEPLVARADNMSSAFERLRKRGAPMPVMAATPAPASVMAPTTAPEPEAELEPAVDFLIDGEPLPAEAETTLVLAPPPEAAPPPPARAVVAPVEIDWARFPPALPVAPEAVAERAAGGSTAVVRVRAGLLDRMVNQAGEVSITRARIDSDVKALQGSLSDLTDSLERMRRQLRDIELQAETQISTRIEAAKAASQTFDPLEMDRFTRFQELTRFMAESVNDVATLQRSLQRTLQSTEDELAAQARLTRELQDDLLRTRMVEFESATDRLYRTVRQAAKETGKQVRLEVVGGAIEIDRGVLERMVGPFEHLLRNSVAHGVELPEARVRAGKDASGLITLTVAQSGNEVAVDVADDGAGLDLARVRARAIERGLLATDAQPGDGELAQMIFMPGFSTAESVTELAGRGVGLDVVRSEVNAMGGRIETHTDAGRGTRFKLLLPLTTAVTQVVMLRCGELQVAVPSTLIEMVRRVPSAEVERGYAEGKIEYAGESVPFFWLASLLRAGVRGEAVGRTQAVVVIRSAAQRVAVHVDEVVGNQEVVVKNVGPQLARMPGLAGVTLLPSGAVALIYNPVALATVYADAVRDRLRRQPLEPDEPQVQQAPVRTPMVMVVDDSLTVRRVTERLLKREGYRVVTAKDGLDALERLAEERPVILLSDIEMPRMDGFDLVRNVRADPRMAGLPVVMISSRIAQKHRDYAAELGVDHYLGKPYSEEELLSLVARYAGADILT